MAAPKFITGQVTSSGGLLPAENIPQAPGDLGAVWISNGSASNAATLTAPGCTAGFVLPVGATVRLILGGVRLTVTGTSPAVSYAYATNGG